MKKNVFLMFIASILLTTSSFAANFELKVNEIHCEKCVQKIHDYFAKNLGNRVQNLKIDMNADVVTFDSISVDAIELENIRKGLEMMGFKIASTKSTETTETTKVIPKKN